MISLLLFDISLFLFSLCVFLVLLIYWGCLFSAYEESHLLLHHHGGEYHRASASIGFFNTASSTRQAPPSTPPATSSSSSSSSLNRNVRSLEGCEEGGNLYDERGRVLSGGFLVPLTPIASSPFNRLSLSIGGSHLHAHPSQDHTLSRPSSSSSLSHRLHPPAASAVSTPLYGVPSSSSSSLQFFTSASSSQEGKDSQDDGKRQREKEAMKIKAEKSAEKEEEEREEEKTKKKRNEEIDSDDAEHPLPDRRRRRKGNSRSTSTSAEKNKKKRDDRGGQEEEEEHQQEEKEKEKEEKEASERERKRGKGVCGGLALHPSRCLPEGMKKKFRKHQGKEEEEDQDGDSQHHPSIRPPAKPLAPYRNSGVAFVTFDNQLCVKECLRNTYRYRAASRARCQNNRSLISFSKVRFSPAPPPSDLRWNHLHVSRFNQLARIVGLNFLLLFLSVTVISPVALLNELTPIVESIDKQLVEHRITRLTITAWLPPLILLFINSFVQPLLVSYVASGSAFWRKSRETAYILHGNIVFQILNTIIIPLLSLSSIESVLEVMYSNEIRDWSVILGFTLMHSSGSFALRYLLNLSFLGIANEMLQIFTLLAMKINRFFFRWTGKYRYPFDIGFAYAQALSVFTLVLLFSVVLPVILPFGILYFCFRYYVDKYNFIYHIYSNVDFNSDGRLAVTAIKYMLFAVAFMQFAMAGLFLTQDDRWMPLAGGLLLLLSMISWIVLLCYSIVPPGTIESDEASLRLAKSTEGVQILLPRQRQELREAYTQPCGIASTCDCYCKLPVY